MSRRKTDPHEAILSLFLSLPVDEQAGVLRELRAAQLGANSTLSTAPQPRPTALPRQKRTTATPAPAGSPQAPETGAA